jgi:anti-anti-sigma regulatory factor
MGLHIPGLTQRGVVVVRLRGVLGEADSGRLTAVLRQAFTTDPQLVIIDLAGLTGWGENGQRQLAGIAVCLAARGGRMVLCGVGGHLRCTESRMAALGWFARRVRSPEPRQHHHRTPPARS